MIALRITRAVPCLGGNSGGAYQIVQTWLPRCAESTIFVEGALNLAID